MVLRSFHKINTNLRRWTHSLQRWNNRRSFCTMLCGKDRGGRGKALNSVSCTVDRRNRYGHVPKEGCRSRILLISTAPLICSSYGMELLLGRRRKREKGPSEDLEVAGCGAMVISERVRSCHGCCLAQSKSKP